MTKKQEKKLSSSSSKLLIGCDKLVAGTKVTIDYNTLLELGWKRGKSLYKFYTKIGPYRFYYDSRNHVRYLSVFLNPNIATYGTNTMIASENDFKKIMFDINKIIHRLNLEITHLYETQQLYYNQISYFENWKTSRFDLCLDYYLENKKDRIDFLVWFSKQHCKRVKKYFSFDTSFYFANKSIICKVYDKRSEVESRLSKSKASEADIEFLKSGVNFVRFEAEFCSNYFKGKTQKQVSNTFNTDTLFYLLNNIIKKFNFDYSVYSRTELSELIQNRYNSDVARKKIACLEEYNLGGYDLSSQLGNQHFWDSYKQSQNEFQSKHAYKFFSQNKIQVVYKANVASKFLAFSFDNID